eukprot:g725.t1
MNIEKDKSSKVKERNSLKVRTIKAGDGTHFPKKGDTCRVHYKGILNPEKSGKDSAKVFDDTRKTGKPFHFRVGHGQVIPGFDEAVLQMSCGQIVSAEIPYELAYGTTGFPPIIPARTDLIYEIELIMFATPEEVSEAG